MNIKQPRQYNFIVAKFGDNDFGNHIKEALEEGVTYWGLDTKACPIIWKQFIIAYLIGHRLKRNAVEAFWDEEKHILFLKNDYFQHLRVTFEVFAPTEDNDGGSAAYDLNRQYAWTF